MFALKLVRTIFRTIVDQKITSVEVFVVGEDEAFIDGFTEMALDPNQLIRLRGRVSPGGCGKHVGIEQGSEFTVRLNRVRYRIHQ